MIASALFVRDQDGQETLLLIEPAVTAEDLAPYHDLLPDLGIFTLQPGYSVKVPLAPPRPRGAFLDGLQALRQQHPDPFPPVRRCAVCGRRHEGQRAAEKHGKQMICVRCGRTHGFWPDGSVYDKISGPSTQQRARVANPLYREGLDELENCEHDNS